MANFLAQSRYWRASLDKGAGTVVLEVLKDCLPEDSRDLRELRIEVPIDRWNRVIKQVRMDRKLLGGILLDFAIHKEHVSAVVASDWLFGELQRVVLDATASLIEGGELVLTRVEVGAV